MNSLKLVNRKLELVLIPIIIYKLLLDISYLIITHYWSYYYELSLDINIYKYVLSYIFLIALAYTTPKLKINNIIYMALNIQLYIMVVPMLSLFGMSNRNVEYTIVVVLCHITQCLISYFLMNKVAVFRYRFNFHLIRTLICIISFFIMLLIINEYGIGTSKAFNFANSYEIREIVKMRFPYSYLVPAMVKVLLPLCTLILFESKK